MFSEISLMAWMSGVIVFAIGGGAGFFIARQIKDKHTLGLEEQLKTTQNRLSEYQDDVNRHFLKTSLLFNKLTDNYREVYEHLATGAQKLCDGKPLTTALDLPETKILAAAATTGTGAAIASEEKPELVAAAPASTDTGHGDTTQPGDETVVSSTEEVSAANAETAPVEDTDLPENTVKEQTATEPVVTDDPAVTASATEISDNAPAITEEELKNLEADEKKKGEDDIHLGAESTPGVELEHHKTHPSIH